MDGNDNKVLADMGCRNTVFTSFAQSGAQDIPQFLDAGIKRFRVELVDESRSRSIDLLEQYHGAITTPTPAKLGTLWKYLSALTDRNGKPQVLK
jgi:U32 family peptidase